MKYEPQYNVKYWAVKAWTWRVEHWDYSLSFGININRMLKDIPKLNEFLYNCSYCEFYSENSPLAPLSHSTRSQISLNRIATSERCKQCQLHDKGITCCKEYQNWRRNIYLLDNTLLEFTKNGHGYMEAHKRLARKWAKRMLKKIINDKTSFRKKGYVQ